MLRSAQLTQSPVLARSNPIGDKNLLAQGEELDIRPMLQAERPGLVVLTIELEGALAVTAGNLYPSKMWSPYREPLILFLTRHKEQARAFAAQAARCCPHLQHPDTSSTYVRSLICPAHPVHR